MGKILKYHFILKAVILFVTSEACANDKWDLYINVGGKGGHTSESSVCYEQNELLSRIPFKDSKPNFEWASERTTKFSSSITSQQNVSGKNIYQITQNIDDGYYQYIVIFAFENDLNELCPFVVSVDNEGAVIKPELDIVSVNSIPLFGYSSEVNGSGSYSSDHYFKFQNGLPKKINIYGDIRRVLSELIDSMPGYDYGTRSGTLNIKRLVYSKRLYKVGACGACQSGDVLLLLALEDDAIKVISKEIDIYKD